MSQENVDAFRRGADAVNRGDVEAVLQLADTEFGLRALANGDRGRVYRPRRNEKFFGRHRKTFQLFQLDYTDVRDLGDRVLGIGSVRVRGRGSRLEADFPSAVIACYRDGLCWRYEDYGDARLALEAAELSE